MMQSSLAPGLLLAVPQLIDPNFGRAVVLMIEHNDRGSFGLIINQPIEMPASELLDSLEMTWNGDSDEVVWSGGPVQPNSGWILHEPLDAVPIDADSLNTGGTLLVSDGLALSTSPDTLRLLGQAPPARLRMLLGYSGWGPGQLAAEMARGSWLHADVDPVIVFDTPAPDMWEAALRSVGIDPQTVIQGFGIH